MASAAESQPDVVVDSYARLDPRVARSLSENAKRLRDAPPHPHLVRVIAVDRVGENWSVTSESVDGIALADVFLRLSLGARLRVVVDVLAGLSALHALDVPVIHGGVLSRVAFVDKTGRTKLGCAYAQSLFMTRDAYAPESLLGDQAAIAPHTDVYGAGVLLWEAITGHELFGVDAPEEIVKKQLAGRIDKALPSARDRWARTVLPVIERALRVNPNDRYTSISEMAAALRIAVRARLMIHEDIVEEIWPAATMPKVQSGVQPIANAPPAVVEASFVEAEPSQSAKASQTDSLQVVPTPSAPIAVSTTTSVVMVRPPHRRTKTFLGVAAGVGLLAIAVGLASFMRAPRVSARADATPEEHAREEHAPGVAAPRAPEIAEPEDAFGRIKPLQAPAASGVPSAPHETPPGAVHKSRSLSGTQKARAYDPSSI